MKDVCRTGVVVIGRNEGESLIRAIESVKGPGRPIVYVDSDSSDESVRNARALGVDHVIELDVSIPLSAARARNEGWRWIAANYPSVEQFQFMDGDMEILEGWFPLAERTMAEDSSIAALCGYRREREPGVSVYNRICDVEWGRGPTTEITMFGGDIMIRRSAMEQVGGYNDRVIAAEDDELAIRLRRETGGRLLRIAFDATTHDARMTSARQWWKRMTRSGHAFAQVNAIHGGPPDHYFDEEVRKSLLWGAVGPAVGMGLALPTLGLSLGVIGARYPVSGLRAALKARKEGFGWDSAIPWGVSCALSPFPEAIGIAKYHADRLRGRLPEIIEHKGPK